MRHYVVYHNRERMGEISKPFQLYTNKPVAALLGNTVWIIEGHGESPKQYTLVCVFVVTEIGESPHADFRSVARGAGHEFQPHVRLDELQWFPELRKAMANFSLGLQELTSENHVTQLQALAEAAGCDIRNLARDPAV